MSCDCLCSVALPHDIVGLAAVCDYGNFQSHSLTFESKTAKMTDILKNQSSNFLHSIVYNLILNIITNMLQKYYGCKNSSP